MKKISVCLLLCISVSLSICSCANSNKETNTETMTESVQIQESGTEQTETVTESETETEIKETESETVKETQTESETVKQTESEIKQDTAQKDPSERYITGGISIEATKPKKKKKKSATLQSSEGKDGVIVYASYEYYSQFLDAVMNRDEETFNYLYNNKYAGILPNGTKCKILEERTFAYEVKITEGDFEGAVVTVVYSDVIED